MLDRKYSDGTIKRLRTKICEIREASISEIGGKDGDKMYGRADRAILILDRLVMELSLEARNVRTSNE